MVEQHPVVVLADQIVVIPAGSAAAPGCFAAGHGDLPAGRHQTASRADRAD
jgi:hypothetical protein